MFYLLTPRYQVVCIHLRISSSLYSFTVSHHKPLAFILVIHVIWCNDILHTCTELHPSERFSQLFTLVINSLPASKTSQVFMFQLSPPLPLPVVTCYLFPAAATPASRLTCYLPFSLPLFFFFSPAAKILSGDVACVHLLACVDAFIIFLFACLHAIEIVWWCYLHMYISQCQRKFTYLLLFIVLHFVSAVKVWPGDNDDSCRSKFIYLLLSDVLHFLSAVKILSGDFVCVCLFYVDVLASLLINLFHLFLLFRFVIYALIILHLSFFPYICHLPLLIYSFTYSLLRLSIFHSFVHKVLSVIVIYISIRILIT